MATEDLPGRNDFGNYSDADLRALAFRVGQLYNHIEALAKGQQETDYDLRDIRRELADLFGDVSALSEDRLTSTEIKIVKDMITGEERSKWLWTRIRLWAYWVGGTLASIYLLRDWLRGFLDFLRAVLK